MLLAILLDHKKPFTREFGKVLIQLNRRTNLSSEVSRIEKLSLVGISAASSLEPRSDIEIRIWDELSPAATTNFYGHGTTGITLCHTHIHNISCIVIWNVYGDLGFGFTHLDQHQCVRFVHFDFTLISRWIIEKWIWIWIGIWCANVNNNENLIRRIHQKDWRLNRWNGIWISRWMKQRVNILRSINFIISVCVW